MNHNRWLVVAGLAVGVVGCGDNLDAPVDTEVGPLRPEGPPEVVAVFALSRIDDREAPIFCRYLDGTRDPFAPDSCPMLASGFTAAEIDPRVPTTPRKSWGLRIVLDEPLDPAALAAPNLVTMTCGAEHTPVQASVRYTAWGNHRTSPPGPSLTLDPDPAALTFPTGTMCELLIGDALVDESGAPVPADQRTYAFKIADLALIEIDAGINGASTTNLAGRATSVLAFNASLDDDTVDTSDFQLVDADGHPVENLQHLFDDDWTVDDDPDQIELNDGAYLRPSPYLTPGTYTIGLAPGATIGEQNGGTLTAGPDDPTQTFTVAYSFVSSVPSLNAGVPIGDPPVVALPPAPASADLVIRFNGAIDPSTVGLGDVTLTDATMTPVPAVVSVGTGLNNDRLFVNPVLDLVPGITYTLALPVGASFDWAGTCDAGATPECQTLTIATARTIPFRVQ